MADLNPATILSAAGFNGNAFKYSDTSLTTMRGPCPKCGGSRRLLIWVDNPLPNWNHACDNCGFSNNQIENVSPDIFGTQINPDREVPDYERNLQDLNDSTHWLDFHHNLEDEHRKWLQDRGVPVEYQNRWLLGYTPRKSYIFDEAVYQCPAYTIPKTGHDLRLTNLDYRLIEPVEGSGKYRSESGLLPSVFIAEPGKTDHERVFIVEGSFKAMVLHIFLEQHDWPGQVIGLPGVGSKLWQEHVYDYPTAYVMMDPDRPHITKQIAAKAHARPIFMPVKIDDAIVAGMAFETFQAIIINSDL